MSNRERLKVTEQLLGGIIASTQVIPLEDVEALAREMEREEAFMPFYDPTSWMRQHEGMRVARNITQAFLAFRQAIEKAKADERARAETLRLRGGR